jgi:hypothetical protein
LTAAKFKPLAFSVPGFALSNIANISIFMILYDFSGHPVLYTAKTANRVVSIWEESRQIKLSLKRKKNQQHEHSRCIMTSQYITCWGTYTLCKQNNKSACLQCSWQKSSFFIKFHHFLGTKKKTRGEVEWGERKMGDPNGRRLNRGASPLGCDLYASR